MTQADPFTITIDEGDSVRVMMRVYDVDNALITQAGISTIKFRVVAGGTTQQTAVTALTVSSVVYDTLQTGAEWTKDSSGYNFDYTLAGSNFPDGGVTYYVPIEFTDTGSNVWTRRIDVTTRETYMDTPA